MAMNPNTEIKLLEQAIAAFNRETGLAFTIQGREVQYAGHYVDALLRLPGQPEPLAAEVKRWVPHANLGALIQQLQQLPKPAVLIADYVNPNTAESLRAQRVQFIDTVGNAYIDVPPTYIFVKGNRPPPENTPGAARRGRAFEPAGLKLTFAFLCDPAAVDLPYRVLAKRADIALGAVGPVIEDLRAAGIIVVTRRRGPRRLQNYQKLLERWTEAYPEKLKPKLRFGDFAADEPDWWKRFEIELYEGYWGGEIAAARYTQHLIPEIATLYVPEARVGDCLRDARLKKYPLGTADGYRVQLYRPFWPVPAEQTDLVHPVLVYADLIATADRRNRETARLIFDQYLAGYIKQD